MSDEDIVPTWARNTVLEIAAQWSPKQPLPPRRKIRICEVCNGKMGKAFENDVADVGKRLLYGQELELTATDQLCLSRLCFKIDMLERLRTKNPATQERTRRHLENLIATGEPPPGSSIRIGRCVMFASPDLDPPVEGLVPPDAWPAPPSYDAVGSIGQIAWESVVPHEGTSLLSFIRATEDNPWMVRIWPPSPMPVRMPERWISYRTLVELGERWAALKGPPTNVSDRTAVTPSFVHLNLRPVDPAAD